MILQNVVDPDPNVARPEKIVLIRSHGIDEEFSLFIFAARTCKFFSKWSLTKNKVLKLSP
jgi:hypothetical protein